MKKKFIGKVKPFLKVEGLRLEIAYGQEISVEDWQANHPHFVYARKNGWVVSSDQKNIVDPKMSYRKWNCNVPIHPAEQPMKAAVTMDEKALRKMLDDQAHLLKSVQQSYNALKNKVAQPAESNTAYLEKTVGEIQQQQRMILDLLSRKQEDKTASLVASVLKEIKQITVSAPAPAPVVQDNSKLVEMFDKLNKTIAEKSENVSGSTSYNKRKEEKQSNIADFEERYIPKVEDFKVKDSHIAAQQTSSDSVDDTLAILKSLKKLKGS